MNITAIIKGTVLVPDSLPLHNCMGSAIQCTSVDDKGFKFKRLSLAHNCEEFFMAKGLMEASKWIEAPVNVQLRFL